MNEKNVNLTWRQWETTVRASTENWHDQIYFLESSFWQQCGDKIKDGRNLIQAGQLEDCSRMQVIDTQGLN